MFLIRTLLAVALTLLIFPKDSNAQISDGQDATSVLGQTFDLSAIPAFFQSGPNNGPNSYGFNAARYTAIDSVGHRLFVSDSSNNRVLVFNLSSTNTITNYKADFVLGQSSFSSNNSNVISTPLGLAYDTSGKQLFVSDSDNARVLIFDVSTITNGESPTKVLGQADLISITATTSQNRMTNPRGLAFDSIAKRLFVADSNRILVFDTLNITSGADATSVLCQPDFTTSSAGISQSKASNLNGLTFDSAGNKLFAADSDNNRVLVFDTASITNGEVAINVLGQSSFLSSVSALSQSGMSKPYGLAYDSVRKNLFVGDSLNARTLVFDVASISDGKTALRVLGKSDFTSSSRVTSRSSTSSAYGLTYDPLSSQLFVADENRVVLFNTSSITNGENAVSALGTVTNFTAPVVDFSMNGRNNGPNIFGFDGVSSIALDLSGHRIYATDGGNRVLVFNLTTGNKIDEYLADFVLGSPNFYSTSTGLPTNPVGLVFDNSGQRLFVSDSGNRVLVYDVSLLSNGQNPVSVLGQLNFTSSLGSTTQNGLNSPGQMAFDATGKKLFVADVNNNRVLVFDVTTIANGENATQVFGQSNFTAQVSALTSSGMSSPRSVAFDEIGQRLFVADSLNNRVLVFDATNPSNGQSAVAVLGQPDFITSTAGREQAKLSQPRGLKYDAGSKRLYVADFGNARVMIFDVQSISNGEDAVNVIGQQNFTSLSLNATKNITTSPIGLDYDSANQRLWVSELLSNRILNFDFAPGSTPTPTPTATAQPTPTNIPIPPEIYTLTISQSGKIKRGQAVLKITAKYSDGKATTSLSRLTGSITCRLGKRSSVVSFTTRSNGTDKRTIRLAKKEMTCSSRARIDGKIRSSNSILLR